MINGKKDPDYFNPIIYTKNIEKLNSAFIMLKWCRNKNFRKVIARIKGFGDIFIAEDIEINGIVYWQTVTFTKAGKGSINISFPYLTDSAALKSPITIYIDGVVGLEAIETLVGLITEELIDQNQT